MAEQKLTKKMKYEMAIKMAEEAGNDILIEFFNHELEILANKASKGSVKKSDEQEAFFEVIRDILSECSNVKGMRCGEIIKDERALNFVWSDQKETSSQRVSAMLKKLYDRGDVIRKIDKKDVYFSLA